MSRPLQKFIVVPAVACVLSSCGKKIAENPIADYERWDPEVVEMFKALPIQEGGRIKPMQAYAQVRLLRYHAKRSMKLQVGKADDHEKEKVSATEWLLDVLFRPELARQFPTFIVNDSDAIVAIGVEEHAKRRSRYSHDEIFPQRGKLADLSQQYAEIEEKDRTGKQNQIVDLGRNVTEFEFINHMFDFAREGLAIELPDVHPDLAGGRVPLSTFLQHIGAVRDASADEEGAAKMAQALDMANRQMGLYLNTARLIAFTPPTDPDEESWKLPSDLMETGVANAASGTDGAAYEIENLRLLEALGAAEPNSEQFKVALSALVDATSAGIEARGLGEADSIKPELALYRGKFSANSQVFLIFGFLLMALGLLMPRASISTWLQRAGAAFGVIAFCLVSYWVTLRCIVMGRPPVANLYETVIFIVAIILLLALLFHFFTKRPIVLPAALFACSIGIFISMLYDRMKGEDTMDPLVAVLNSNFWLATHVTIITMGYAAGLLAAVISHVFIFSKLLGCKDRDFLRDATRMTYAVICFTLLFSLVGTILGGIWANVSWGRFWGWDPKENGALMIVLATLAILHARLGGYIKQDGVHFCSIGLGMVVAFSWWYVNVMGVGLHSYGFTSGIKRAVWIFWIIEVFVIALGVLAYFLAKSSGSPPRPKRDKVDVAPEPAASSA